MEEILCREHTAEKRILLNPSETIEYFKLSQRKFYALIREKTVNDFYHSLWQSKIDHPNGI